MSKRIVGLYSLYFKLDFKLQDWIGIPKKKSFLFQSNGFKDVELTTERKARKVKIKELECEKTK